MRVAIAGGGIFGCTTAFLLARAGHDVHLFEPKRELMKGASGSSFYRFHQGYHYPRSPTTGRECREAEVSFREEYGDCLIEDGIQLYAIAKDSITSGDEFMAFMDRERLEYVICPGVSKKSCTHVFEVREPRIDETRMAEMAIARLFAAGVKVHTGTPLPEDSRDRFDKIVVCTYENINSVLSSLGVVGEEYKFQVVEKPIINMGKNFKGVSIVILDGPFCCLDPHGKDHHVLGHVTEANHCENVGLYPEIPSELAPYINSGVHDCPLSKKDRIISAAKDYIPAVGDAEYIGSMFTVRAHLAGVEDTDKRPTLIREHGQVLSVFSGKLGTAVEAGQEILTILDKQDALLRVEAIPAHLDNVSNNKQL